MSTSIMTNSDSYKKGHFRQLPAKTVRASSYIEARSGKVYPFTMFAGIQPFLEKLRAPTRQEVIKYAGRMKRHGVSFNLEGWLAIADLGYLPLRIQAIREGTILPVSNVLVQVENTDDRFPWLASYAETAILRAIWYPTTVATRSRTIKNIIREFLEVTADDLSALDFMLHDFGARGVSSEESAGIGGVAHLFNFLGTDNDSALDYADSYYGEEMAGFSVDAMEHFTVTAWGRENEAEAYENMIDTSSDRIFSIVPDSYDIENAVKNIFGVKLKVKIQELEGRLVVRPDSGDPASMVLKVVQMLDEAFGTTLNGKGYKVLPRYLRVLQGDGINETSIRAICGTLVTHGYSVENMVFGMGGELLQNITRDTMAFAMKCSAVKDSDDSWRDVQKDPKTDTGKRSKAGRLALIHTGKEGWQTIRETELGGRVNMLETVWMNGKTLRFQSLSEIRSLSSGL